MSTPPSQMPQVPGYDVAGAIEPAESTGGDTCDLALVDGKLLVVLGDATGHGIAPALSATQRHAMLRTAFRQRADLETLCAPWNDRLADSLADDRFIPAFIGLVDPVAHSLAFLSGGRGPVFHYRAASGRFDRHAPASFPPGAMALHPPRHAVSVALAPGDILVVLSDAICEYADRGGIAFGDERVREIVRTRCHEPVAKLLDHIYAAVREHAAGVPQADDMTGVLVRRQPDRFASRRFPRRVDAIVEMVGYTSGFAAEHGIDRALLPTVDLAIEELFTNMVKYSPSTSPEVRIDLAAVEDGIEVTLVDRDVDPFDPTRAPDVDVSLPIERRRPGGLGLHLVRKLVDDYRYHYAKSARRSTIAFRVYRPPVHGAASPRT